MKVIHTISNLFDSSFEPVEITQVFSYALLNVSGSGITENNVRVSVVAAEALPGHKVVTASGFLANQQDADVLLGITTSAVSPAGIAEVVFKGVINESSWNWVPNSPLFLGNLGNITQTPSSSGKIRRIGIALSPTSINVDFFPTITQ